MKLKIDPSSSINMGAVRLKENCLIKVDEQSQIVGSLTFDRDNASIIIGKRVFMSGSLIAARQIEIGDDVAGNPARIICEIPDNER